ncbi:MAG: translation factor GTPase family protein, partial [Acutalibacteraceae bacterium]|nr:translation factor GTPase family protein [Acutalibacteraceae bacterium]
MKQITVGVLAHVDAGKTTLSEAMLYEAGAIRQLGRVDHRTSFLDTNVTERERGITIFSKQAVLDYGDTHFTLLDTPGHVDFSAEMERTLQVLDYALLIISGTEGVQSHTQTLWELLRKYRVPCFIFVNKMDLSGADQEYILRQLQARLSDGCIDFSVQNSDSWCESVAGTDDAMLEEYCNSGTVSHDAVVQAIRQRKIFPCLFGSALRMEGMVPLLQMLSDFTVMPPDSGIFGAKVFKVAEDKQGQRLTFLKVSGGCLRVREILSSDKNIHQEKVAQIRLYSGDKFTAAETAEAGTVCAVTGIHFALPGDGLGAAENTGLPILAPVMTYSLILPPEISPHTALEKLRTLEEEDPQLHIVWNERFGKIQINVMGEVQAEVLKTVIRERFGFEVQFGAGSIIYKETITDTVEGIGHFEPLRHYAEVHLVMKPASRNSGLVFRSECPEDMLSKNWQRLILTHLYEKTHLGVLTASPITDMEI